METRVLIWSASKPNAAFPPPQWCFRQNLVVIGLLVSEIFMFESVDARTHGRTPARVPSYKLTLWAFGSGELKSETGPIPWTFWYILIKFCIPITIGIIYTEGLPNLAQEIAKWHLTSVEAVPSSKFWKKWKWPNWVDCCDETLHTHWYWQDVAQEIVKCHLGLAEALPRFRFWKTEKLSWNFLNILIKLCTAIAIDVSLTERLPNVIYHQ